MGEHEELRKQLCAKRDQHKNEQEKVRKQIEHTSREVARLMTEKREADNAWNACFACLECLFCVHGRREALQRSVKENEANLQQQRKQLEDLKAQENEEESRMQDEIDSKVKQLTHIQGRKQSSEEDLVSRFLSA